MKRDGSNDKDYDDDRFDKNQMPPDDGGEAEE